MATGVRCSYLRVDEELLDRHPATFGSAEQLVAAVYAVRAGDLLRRTRVSSDDRSSAAERIAAIQHKTRGRDPGDLDAEIRRLREDPDA